MSLSTQIVKEENEFPKIKLVNSGITKYLTPKRLGEDTGSTPSLPPVSSEEIFISDVYSEIANYKYSGTLIPGAKYEITDYGIEAVSGLIGHKESDFSLILTAVSNESFSPIATAYSQWHSDYNGLEILYSIEPDFTSFDYVNGDSKGLIYYMKDIHGNEAPYDFINTIINYNQGNYIGYTFGDIVYQNTPENKSYTCNNVVIKPYRKNNKWLLPLHHIGQYCNNITIEGGCSRINIPNFSRNIKIESGCHNITMSSSDTLSTNINIGNVLIHSGITQANISDLQSIDFSNNDTFHPFTEIYPENTDVRIIANNGIELPDMESSVIVYSANDLSFNGNNYINTNYKLCSGQNFTIIMQFTGSAMNRNGSDNHMLLHCMVEQNPWPGIAVQISGSGTACYQVNLYRSHSVWNNIPYNDTARHSLIIKRQGTTWSVILDNVSKYSGPITDYNDIPEEDLLLGAYKDINGNIGRYWYGTIHSIIITEDSI